jgi:hypothetical protein
MPQDSVRQNMSDKHARNTHTSKRKTNIYAREKKRQNRVNHKKNTENIYIYEFSTSRHMISLA